MHKACVRDSLGMDSSETIETLHALTASVERKGSRTNIATNSMSIGTDTRLFHANFIAGQWTGDVFALPVTASGVGSSLLWQASQEIPAPAQRRLFTYDGSGGVAFTWTNLTAAQKSALGSVAVHGYLRGETTGERRNGGNLRNRNAVLGDGINSSPTFVKDTNTVYVGANDGMLHAFNSNTGAEVFGYVPDGIDFKQLKTLTDPEYAHRYFVDGAVIVSSQAQTPNKNMLVGALGRGGKGIYVLDVTNPSSFSAGDVKWRKNGSDVDMGQVLGTPIIAKLNNGKTGVVVANGINSTSEKAVLFIYDITDGSVLAKINTNAGSPTSSNGLSTPRGWDADGDGTLDFIYAGDLLGNVWKFDLSDKQANKWKVDNSGNPLFVAKDAAGNRQPITGGMSVGLHPVDFSTWVFFGTGRFLSTGDLANKDTQSMYGLIDAGAAITGGRADLMQRTIVSLGSNSGKDVRGFEPAGDLTSGKKGWYIDLLAPPSATAEGERIIANSAVIGRVLLTASIIPSSDPCKPGGRGFINALDAFTGASVDSAFFDVNGNGIFTDDTIGGSPIGSVDLGVGMPTMPAVIDTLLVAGGSLGTVGSIAVTNPSNTGRISWREVIGD
ncbi:MAG: PilC/PilY family type IV pilus protein [Xanthomonadaceae bacterium]|nr:PilC/PilY family type IV pilus protein [Xanthomonadaceae bacterium]MDP2184325.1 PilC/PilY family type IV pilus protein [Xanthomonadales bacterium]MDZ4116779.1 PilC/PilY family type IV pilus protein [Xanthomonadaceae bacterium]MDZ4377652.1 PilC/PilY family type IV pilus protein [Xanthomonadaceae bacterium]